MLSRRAFLRRSALALTASSCLPAYASSAGSGPLGKPIGIQLYTVRTEMTRDLMGTLKMLSQIGFREVEMAGYYGKGAKELRKILMDLNLKPTSSHRGLTDVPRVPSSATTLLSPLAIRCARRCDRLHFVIAATDASCQRTSRLDWCVGSRYRRPTAVEVKLLALAGFGYRAECQPLGPLHLTAAHID